MNDWISNLKPGDKVFVNGNNRKDIGTVERITPSGIIVVDGELYNKSGERRGGNFTYWRPWITEYSEKEQREIEKTRREKRTLNFLIDFNFRSLSPELCAEIEKLIKDSQK